MLDNGFEVAAHQPIRFVVKNLGESFLVRKLTEALVFLERTRTFDVRLRERTFISLELFILFHLEIEFIDA